jgi:hypothetical protein
MLATASVAAAAAIFAAQAGAATGKPVNTAAPTIAGAAATGQTLTASPGTWQGDGSISYAYQWELCDGTGAKCAVVARATSRTNTIAAASQGGTFRVLVTATNAAGSTTVASAATDVVSLPLVGKLTLKAPSLVAYGKKVTLSGTVPGAPHTTVWIEANGYPFPLYKQKLVASVETDANGAFSVKVQPTLNTTYYAEQDGMRSPALAVNVLPRLLVTPAGRHQFLVQALADNSLAGKTVVLQRWNATTLAWVPVMRLTLRGSFAVGGGSTASIARIKAPGLVGAKTRVFLASKVPGYSTSPPAVFRG